MNIGTNAVIKEDVCVTLEILYDVLTPSEQKYLKESFINGKRVNYTGLSGSFVIARLEGGVVFNSASPVVIIELRRVA